MMLHRDAEPIAGSLIVPNDRTHRMGWFLPPAIVRPAGSFSGRGAPAPAGPVAGVANGDLTAGWYDREAL